MVLPPPDCADEPLVVAIHLLPAEKDRGVRQSSLDVGTGDRRLRRVGHHRPIGDAVVLVARSRVVVELVIAEHTDVLGFQEKVETLEREGLVTNDGTQCRGVSALVSDRVVRDGLVAVAEKNGSLPLGERFLEILRFLLVTFFLCERGGNGEED